MPPVIHTIGYDHLPSVGELAAIMLSLNISNLIDVRSKPFGNPRWSKPVLTKAFGARYEWWGGTLGGRGRISKAALRSLADINPIYRLMLMCKEEAPGDCHRHSAIAVPLLALNVDCVHVFKDVRILASELIASAAAHRNYKFDLLP